MSVFKNARDESVLALARMGLSISRSLPTLELQNPTRDLSEISTRMLGLYGVIVLSFSGNQGLGPIRAWIAREQLGESLSPTETDFISGNASLLVSMRWRIEGLYALSWACGKIGCSILDFVPDDFVAVFPSIPKSEPTSSFRERLKLKDYEQIIFALDLLYCLDSAMTDLHLRSEAPPPRAPLVLDEVKQRRRALEWLFSKEDWDDIELDT